MPAVAEASSSEHKLCGTKSPATAPLPAGQQQRQLPQWCHLAPPGLPQRLLTQQHVPPPALTLRQSLLLLLLLHLHRVPWLLWVLLNLYRQHWRLHQQIRSWHLWHQLPQQLPAAALPLPLPHPQGQRSVCFIATAVTSRLQSVGSRYSTSRLYTTASSPSSAPIRAAA